MKIRTTHVYPPIPIRSFDWSAVDEDTYDADCDQDGFFSLSPIGYGATEAEAIADLKEQLEQNDDAPLPIGMEYPWDGRAKREEAA